MIPRKSVGNWELVEWIRPSISVGLQGKVSIKNISQDMRAKLNEKPLHTKFRHSLFPNLIIPKG